MKKTLIAIIIGTFALMSYLTAGELSSALPNELNNNLQIEIQLDRIEYISNQPLTGTFRLKLHAGSEEIYNEIIDFSAGHIVMEEIPTARIVMEEIPTARIVMEEIPTARIGNLDIFGAELFITIEAVDSGASDHRYVGRLDAAQAFDVMLNVEQGNQSSEIMVQGSIRVE